MMSMFQYLCDVKQYSENDNEETVLSWKYGFEIPTKIRTDIEDYYKYRFSFINPNNKNGAR